MAEKIKIDLEGLSKSSRELEEAMAEFRPYSEDFIRETAWSMKGFQSDFTEKAAGLLENMTDTGAWGLLESLEGLRQEIRDFGQTFRDAEETAGNQWKEGG